MAAPIGRLTSVHVKVTDPLATGDAARAWRFDPATAGAGLFLDLASHYFDIIDFLAGPISSASGFALNTGGTYAAEDVTAAAFQIGTGVVGTGVWNFNAPASADSIVFTGSRRRDCNGRSRRRRCRGDQEGEQNTYRFRNPPHVHQPLIQTIVDELRGQGTCESPAKQARERRG